MLDPKEEAIRLVEKYELYVQASSLEQLKHHAKQCALIDVQNTIDQLIDIKEWFPSPHPYISEKIDFYNQVKEHIKQL